ASNVRRIRRSSSAIKICGVCVIFSNAAIHRWVGMRAISLSPRRGTCYLDLAEYDDLAKAVEKGGATKLPVSAAIAHGDCNLYYVNRRQVGFRLKIKVDSRKGVRFDNSGKPDLDPRHT